MRKEGAIPIFLIVIMAVSASGFTSSPRDAQAANSVWYGGAQSYDSSALPNVGVRAIINIVNQPSMPAGTYLLPWISDDLSNGIWLQAGYYNQPGSGPIGFMEIWNLNTGTILQSKYPPVTLGPHTFSIYLESGTTWAIAYDGAIWTSYDAGVSVSSSSYPVYSVVEMQAPSAFPFQTVGFPTAMQVTKSAGASWTNVVTASSYGTIFGSEGHLQNGALTSNQINVGSSIPTIAAGTTLWNSNSIGTADLTPPTITVPSSMAVQATSATGAVVTYTVTATDPDGVLASGPTCTPSSGSLFPIGTTTVVCTASDAAGNTATSAFTITVLNSGPSVSINNPGNGATVSGDVSTTVTASSPLGISSIQLYVDNALQATSTASQTSFILNTSTIANGDHTLKAVATDSANNQASTLITVNVQNTAVQPSMPPTLSLPSAITTQATSGAGAVVTYTVKGTDYTGLSIPVICTPASGSTFPIASTTVSCTATDKYGNTASGKFTVTVVDNTAPTATITGPAAGSKVSGTVTISVSASDNTGIASVNLYIDGKLKTTETSAPYSYSWNTKSYKSGTHTIMAIITDLYGNSSTVTEQVTK